MLGLGQCRPRPALLTSVLILTVLVIPSFLSKVSADPGPTIKVDWYPHFATPHDNVTIQANVTSVAEVKMVTIFYRLGPPGLQFNSSSDYKKEQMFLTIGSVTNGKWYYAFNIQANGTTIYFFVSAVDSGGSETTWPGNYPDYRNPRRIEVRDPSNPYLSDIRIYLNDLSLSDLLQEANITVSVSGYLPSFPEPFFRDLEVSSNGPYRYRFARFTIYEDPDNRFYYAGRSSGLIDLIGSVKQVPYDKYTVSLNIAVPYRFENLSRVAASAVVVMFGSTSIWNAWNVPKPVPVWYQVGNETRITLETVLSRRVPVFYPPLVLMLVAFTVLGLVPLISRYYWEKRFDVFLSAIILASSAELSESLYPAGGFHGDTVFLESFAIILISAVIMMAVSSLPVRLRKWSRYGFSLEFFSTVGIVTVISIFIFFQTNFPTEAKHITPFAGGAGSIIFLANIVHSRLSRFLRGGFHLQSKKHSSKDAKYIVAV